MKLKWSTDIINGYAFKSEGFTDDGIPIVRQSNLKSGKITHDGRCYPRDQIPTKFMLREGDICIGLSGSIENFGVIDRDDLPCALNQRVGALRVKREKSYFRFVEYFVQSKIFKDHIASNLPSTTIVNIDGSLVGNSHFPDFDLPTQRAIADFLDRETARIDLLIEKKQRLVALLGEKAKVAKLDLVTGKGSGSIRDTKIVWSPHIPAHWEERAVWMLFELGRGRVISHEYIAENEGPYPIYSSQTADDGVMGSIGTYDFDGEYLTWTTDGAKAGTVFRRKGKFNCTNVCGTLRPLTKSVDLDYAQFALDMATDFFVRHDINPKLMNGVMSKIRIPYPPLDEQQEIGRRIMGIEAAYRPIALRTQVSIDRLKEYRSALITAAVTGQINVAEWGKAGSNERLLNDVQTEMEH